MTEKRPTTPDRILALGNAFKASKALLSAVELGLFSTLAKGACDLETLRLQIGVSERCTHAATLRLQIGVSERCTHAAAPA